MLGNDPVRPMLPAVNLERARKFYVDKLGLRVLGEIPGVVILEAGNGTSIGLYERAATKADHTAAAWDVPNLEETVRQLKQAGVVFESYDYPGLKTDEDNIMREGGIMAAWFKDTEGNILGITQTS